ncbi:MAG: hypothetical protein IKK82_09405, partial [Kiritimatiellae bacterium]|nr:hypothetical protein [Kiritimatiellia bacterium]
MSNFFDIDFTIQPRLTFPIVSAKGPQQKNHPFLKATLNQNNPNSPPVQRAACALHFEGSVPSRINRNHSINQISTPSFNLSHFSKGCDPRFSHQTTPFPLRICKPPT